MNVIWKFTLDPFSGTVKVPVGAKFIHAHEQNGQVRLWAECNVNVSTDTSFPAQTPMEERRIIVVPTGGEIPADAASYIGSVHLSEDLMTLVFHLYEAKP